MARKAFAISAILIVIIVVVSIIISLINLKPVEFKSVVSYEPAVMTAATSYVTSSGDRNMDFISSLLDHKKTIMVFSIIIIIIFTLLFYGAKRSKS